MSNIINREKTVLCGCFAARYFWPGAFLYFLLMWVSPVWSDENHQGHITAELLTGKYPPDYIDYTYFFKYYAGTVMRLFVPMIAGFLAVTFLLDKEKSRYKRFEMARVGKRTYLIGNYIGGCLVSALAFAAAYTAYAPGIFLCFMGDISLPEFFRLYSSNLFQGMLYGMGSAVMAQVLSAFLRSRYLIICIPFLAHYLYDCCQNALFSYFIEQEKYEYLGVFDALRFDAVLEDWNQIRFGTFLFYVVFFFGGMGIYYSVCGKRKDVGV